MRSSETFRQRRLVDESFLRSAHRARRVGDGGRGWLLRSDHCAKGDAHPSTSPRSRSCRKRRDASRPGMAWSKRPIRPRCRRRPPAACWSCPTTSTTTSRPVPSSCASPTSSSSRDSIARRRKSARRRRRSTRRRRTTRVSPRSISANSSPRRSSIRRPPSATVRARHWNLRRPHCGKFPSSSTTPSCARLTPASSPNATCRSASRCAPVNP